MKDRRLAGRYARALLAALPDPAVAQRVDEFLTELADAAEATPEARRLLLDPAIPAHKRRAALKALAATRQLPDTVVRFIDALVNKRRTPVLPAIAAVFREEREARMGIVAAEVTTAQPLTEAMVQRTRQALRGLTGRDVRLACHVDSGLLGGAVTRIGSKVYDGSLRTQLAQLRREMLQE